MARHTKSATWRELMQTREAELDARVSDERAALSPFRRDEAVALALSPDEQSELRELRFILSAFDAELVRRVN